MTGPDGSRIRGVAVTLLAAMALAAAVTDANAASGAASGGNIGFLKDAPLTRFTGADLELFRQNLNAALEQNADGEVRHWQNADTGSAGDIELVGSFTRDGKRCRTVWISNRARGYAEARTDAVFCRGIDGAWKDSPASRPAAPAK